MIVNDVGPPAEIFINIGVSVGENENFSFILFNKFEMKTRERSKKFCSFFLSTRRRRRRRYLRLTTRKCSLKTFIDWFN